MDAFEIADILNSLIDKKLDKATKNYKRGIVSSVSGQLADIKIEGSTTATKSILCLDIYKPVVNDKVLVLSIGDSGANLVCLGGINQVSTLSNYLQKSGGTITGNLTVDNKITANDLTATGDVDFSGASSVLLPLIAFQAYVSQDYTNSPSSYNVVVFDSEIFDYGNCFDTINRRFVAPIKGLYSFFTSLYVNGTSGNGFLSYRINGSGTMRRGSKSNKGSWYYSFSETIELDAGDYVEIYVYSYTKETVFGGIGWNNFSGHLVTAL